MKPLKIVEGKKASPERVIYIKVYEYNNGKYRKGRTITTHPDKQTLEEVYDFIKMAVKEGK